MRREACQHESMQHGSEGPASSTSAASRWLRSASSCACMARMAACMAPRSCASTSTCKDAPHPAREPRTCTSDEPRKQLISQHCS